MGGWAATAAPLSAPTQFHRSSLSRAPASRVTPQHPTLGPGFKPKTETQNHFCDAKVNVKSESFSIKSHFLLTSGDIKIFV